MPTAHTHAHAHALPPAAAYGMHAQIQYIPPAGALPVHHTQTSNAKVRRAMAAAAAAAAAANGAPLPPGMGEGSEGEGKDDMKFGDGPMSSERPRKSQVIACFCCKGAHLRHTHCFYQKI